MFQQFDSDGLAEFASCLLDIGLRLNSKITKMIIKANSKSSLTPSYTKARNQINLNSYFLQIVPQADHQNTNVFPSRPVRVDPALNWKPTMSSKGDLIVLLPWFSSGCPRLTFVRRCPGLNQSSAGSICCPGLEHHHQSDVL